MKDDMAATGVFSHLTFLYGAAGLYSLVWSVEIIPYWIPKISSAVLEGLNLVANNTLIEVIIASLWL